MGHVSVGITIQGNVVHLAWLRTGLKRLDVLDAVSLPVPEGQEPWFFAAEQVRETASVRKMGKVDCTVGLSAAGAFVRVLEFPFAAPGKIAKVLPLELEAALPIALDQIRHDHQLLPSRDKNCRRVLVAAVPEIEAGEVARAFAGPFAASLNVDLDVSGLLALGVRLKSCMPDQFLLLRIFGERLDIVCVNQGRCVLHRSSVFSKVDFFPGVQGEDRAELDAFETSQGQAARYTGKAVRLISLEISDFSPQQVVLCGEVACDSSFQSALELDLDIPVQSMTDALQGSTDVGGQFAELPDGIYPALGLALQPQQYGTGYDLMGTARGRDFGAVLKSNIVSFVILMCVLLGGWVGAELYKINIVEAKRAEVSEVIRSTVRKMVPVSDSLNNAQYVSLVRARLEKARGETSVRERAETNMPISEALLAVSRSVEKCGGIVVSSMVVDRNDLNLSGRAESFGTVESLADALEATGLGRVSIERAKAAGQDEGVDFSLDIKRRAQ